MTNMSIDPLSPEGWAEKLLDRPAQARPTVKNPNPLDKQIGGSHYKDYAIQPVEFIHKNSLGFLEGNIVKYTCRHHKKGGKEDLLKAMHYLQILLELEYPGSITE